MYIMKQALLIVGLCLIASGQSPKTLRQEFPREFKARVPIRAGDFEVTPYTAASLDSHLADDGSIQMLTVRYYGKEPLTHTLLEVFYEYPVPFGSREIKPGTALLLHKTVIVPILGGLESGSDPVPVQLKDIRMIRVIGLTEKLCEEIR